MIDEFLSAWFAWEKLSRLKKNRNEERREERLELEEEIESDQEEDIEREK